MNKKKAGKKKKSQYHKLDHRRRMETFYRTYPRNRKKENCIRRKRTNFRHRERDYTNGNGKSDKETEEKESRR